MAGRVVVSQRMVGIPLFDEDVEYDDSTSLFAVREKIVAKHGGTLHNVRMWRDTVEPTNIIRDYRLSIRDTFRLSRGNTMTATGDNDIKRVTVHYDFSPQEGNSALLKVNMREA